MLEALFSQQMEWRQPLWLWLVLIPVVWALLQKLMRGQQKQNYADSALWPWVATQDLAQKVDSSSGHEVSSGFLKTAVHRFKVVLFWLIRPTKLLALAWLCLVIAFAGPRSLDNRFDVQSRHGVDVMLSIDLSQSMLAEDVRPSRFLFAKSLAETLVNQLESHDRIGLSVFAGQPHSVVPLTYDKQVLQRTLNLIEPGLLPTKGSWLDLALIHDIHLLQQTSNAAKVLVVFTDGAPLFWKPQELPSVMQGLPAALSQAEADTGVKVIYVGMGLSNAAVIPDKTDDSGKLHASGLLVQSRLEKTQLMKLAQKTQGDYLQAEPGPDFMRNLSEMVLKTAAQYEQKTPQQVWRDHAQPFMVVAVISLLFAFYLWQISATLSGQVKRRTLAAWSKFVKQKLTTNSVNSWLFALLVTPLFLASTVWSDISQAADVSSQAKLKQAYEAFQTDSYELAGSLYDSEPGYEGWFGAGASAYREDDLEAAVLYFRQAAWQSPTDNQRALALYNLGNSYYLANLLPQAIEAFEQAMLYQKNYKKAQHNLALAQYRHKLELEGKLRKQNKDKKSKDKGGSGQDNSGAFYGGQMPESSDSKSPGVGSDGDSDNGNKQGNKVKIPDADNLTNYRLNPSIAKLRLNSVANDSSGSKVLIAQQNQQRAEQLEHELQQLQEDQKTLLKRIFEREEGFQAAQEKAHEIPGVQPW